MIIQPKANRKDALLVAAVYEYQDRTEFISLKSQFNVYPAIYLKSEIVILENHAPQEWERKSYESEQGKYTISSFTEWANNPTFFNWLIESDYFVEENKLATRILQAKYLQYAEDYAKKYFGSVKKAKEAIIKDEYSKKMRLHLQRGYERPQGPDLSPEALRAVFLDIKALLDAKDKNPSAKKW